MPAGLERLPELAGNLWWSWHAEARELFRALDENLWRQTRHNPVRLLQEIAPGRLARAAADPHVLQRYARICAAFDHAVKGKHNWCVDRHPQMAGCTLAFFSAEYGLHNSLPLYAGGLGILAGDIAKESSDLGLPFVGVGFMYPHGYFRQHVNADGRQEEVYEQIDRSRIPVMPVLAPDGKPLRFSLILPDRLLHVEAWTVAIGRAVLYLIETDLEENAPGDRALTGRLYGGDQSARLLQEIVLGIGGVRLLRALGIQPTVWHGNEGHTALMMLERVREAIVDGASFDEAVGSVRASTVFTTHTPVPAGHDAFPFELVEAHVARLGGYGEEMDAYRDRAYKLATHDEGGGAKFNLTALALRLSAHVNAVSQKHGEISRAMWKGLWPDRPEDEVPITSVTNGVHTPTWVGNEMNLLLRKNLGEDWLEHHDDPGLWKRLASIPDEDLWKTRLQMKAALFQFLRERVRQRWVQNHFDPGQAIAFGALFDPDVFTIGFARRFATYKRAGLIFRDLDRLRTLLTDPHRPMQILFSGKSHPADELGKDVLQSIFRAARDPVTAGRIAILEDYDMHTAHWLVQGVDLWLNNPRVPLEACGTSGMKAGMNGVPNASVLDGWWIEGYDGKNGWAFGGPSGPKETLPEGEADARDADALYRVLQEKIAPLFYDRGPDGVPHGWIEVVRHAIQTVTPAFSARRMMKEYVERMYVPAARDGKAPRTRAATHG